MFTVVMSDTKEKFIASPHDVPRPKFFITELSTMFNIIIVFIFC